MATSTIFLPLLGGLDGTNPPAVSIVNGCSMLLFDASTDEIIHKRFRLPTDYSSGATLKLQFSMASATSGNVVWGAEVWAVTPADAADSDTTSYDTANSVTEAVPGTAGYLDEASITLTNADSMAAGDLVTLRIRRDADNASDTAAGDAELRAISLEYTTA